MSETTADDPKPGHLFFTYAQEGIRFMARAGMNDHQIACVLCSVRAGAIYEERLRVSTLADRNPPSVGIRSQTMEVEMLKGWGETISQARTERKAP